jgi:manganese/zinc/iron transport system substrate-binding protein
MPHGILYNQKGDILADQNCIMTRIACWLWTFDIRWLAVLILLVAGGCDGTSTGSGSPRDPEAGLRIVCTTGMVADLVRQVAGDRAAVVALMGEGVDPHLYVPTRNDTAQLLAADVVFYNGLMLEGQMERTLESLAHSGRPAFAVTGGLPAELLRSPPEFAGHPDPHVWMDVRLWSRTVDEVVRRLSEINPAEAAAYAERGAAYQAELARLDEYVRQVISSIPESQRTLVTAHDAFSYFSRAYGIRVEAIQGISTESEPGVDDINRLVELLVSQQIPAIFVESSVNEANLHAVQEGARSRGWEVRLGGTLFSDAMGASGTYEGTYIGMLVHNATTIARALQGTVPEQGFRDWPVPAE